MPTQWLWICADKGFGSGITLLLSHSSSVFQLFCQLISSSTTAVPADLSSVYMVTIPAQENSTPFKPTATISFWMDCKLYYPCNMIGDHSISSVEQAVLATCTITWVWFCALNQSNCLLAFQYFLKRAIKVTILFILELHDRVVSPSPPPKKWNQD